MRRGRVDPRPGRSPVRARATTLAALVACATAACDAPHHALDPAARAAAAIEWLWWVLFSVSLVVFVVVIALWAYAIARRRDDAADPGRTEPVGRSMAWILGGGVVTAIILVGLTAVTLLTSSRIAPASADPDALLVEVVGHQFWWEVRYPDAAVITANEIHVPAGEPVRLRLSSNDVIHSLWFPRLHGKLDLTPGRTTEMVIQPDEPGTYRGFCAEFCGRQHALMGVMVVAQTRAEFDAWLEQQARPATAPADPDRARGLEVYLRHDCQLCHQIRGADIPDISQAVGPDLTHVASRRTLAAVTVENTTEMLARWIADPHTIKPGVLMPATDLPRDDLRALVLYLGGLR